MVREDILQQFPELFGTKKVNGREVHAEETIATLTRELRPAIAEALSARRTLLESAEPVRRKYAWPRWEETFEDPVTGGSWTFRQIVQGMIDNFLDRESEQRWRLNDEVPIPADVHPLQNPGLELTGPWHPPDMAFNALNSDAPMNMPDFEDASPAHFQPQGASQVQVGTFAALQNAKEILEGRWAGKPYEVVKKDNKRTYKINRPPQQWPTRLVRPPSIHVLYDHVTVDGQPAPGLIAVIVLWVLNNYDALKQAGTGVYFYIPKMQTPREALIVEKLLARVEGIIGVPGRHIQNQDSLRGRQRRPLSAGDRLGLPATTAGNQCRPLGLSRQPDRDVERRPQRRFSRSANGRHGCAEHDRLPALQRAHDAHGGHEAWRTHPGSAHRRDGGGHGVSDERCLRSLAV